MRAPAATPKQQQAHAGIEAEYLARTTRSAAWSERAGQVLPGGETRAVTSYPPYPVVVVQAQGARLEDADGRSYLDLVNNYTSLVHGNAFAPVTDAVAALLPGGVAFASPHPAQIELAERLCSRVDSVERVRFTNSGTEASLLAVRIAQRATRRSRILLFEGAYHGSASALTAGCHDVVTVPWNDIERATEVLATGTAAAVFAEPFLGAGGVRPAAPGFLAALELVAKANGTLFVVDEVQSLRVGPRGAQGLAGLTPDLTIFGKIIGGGFPIGAVGGRTDLMNLTVASLTPDHVAHAGTFNGHLAAAVAGRVTLDRLDTPAIDRLNAAAATLADRIGAASVAAGVAAEVTRAGSILNVHFDNPAHWAPMHLALLLEGVYAAPRGMANLSTALTEADLRDVADAYARAFARVAG
ncbi:aminotransferase class III-fold pyridoxal phosphate-dependent enzyme [Streptomyces sp. MN03-5084-2B]|nr:aminotransferase class III-fold pyridoxal phosphate-dependent enzyme [Streptomyces sp. MN03-5084-2B]